MSVTRADEALFMTDEQIADRLRRLENGLADFEARIPAMRREAAVIRRWLVRDELRSDQVGGADARELGQPPDPSLAEPRPG